MRPASHVRRSSRGLIHALAVCRECDWSEDYYLRAARAATKHVRETGHSVSVEQATVYSVGLRKEKA